MFFLGGFIFVDMCLGGFFSVLFSIFTVVSFFFGGGGVFEWSKKRELREIIEIRTVFIYFSDYSFSLYLYFLFSVLTASAVSPLAPAPTAIGTDIHNRYKKA